MRFAVVDSPARHVDLGQKYLVHNLRDPKIPMTNLPCQSSISPIMRLSPILHHTSKLKPEHHLVPVRNPVECLIWYDRVQSTSEIAKSARFENLPRRHRHAPIPTQEHALDEFSDSTLDVLSEEPSVRNMIDVCISSVAGASRHG